MQYLKQLVIYFLVLASSLFGMPTLSSAAIVSTDALVQGAASSANRDKVQAFLAREDVRSGMARQGLRAEDALARVNAMTDEEVATLAGRVDSAPAGGDVLGLAFTIFIILLVTDILGLTKVFPFTRAIR